MVQTNSAKGIRSSSTNTWLSKFWGPLIFAVPALGIFIEHFATWLMLLGVPFLIAAVFEASVAILEVRDGTLRYKRFITWTTIRDDEIMAAGITLPAFIGYVRLNRFIFPWGRLYFALDADSNPNPFRPADHALLRHLRGEISQEHDSVDKGYSKGIGLLTMGAIGALTSATLHWVVQTPPSLLESLKHQRHDGLPIWITVPMFVYNLLGAFPLLLVFFALFVSLATYKRHEPNAWTFAFLAGYWLPYIVARLF